MKTNTAQALRAAKPAPRPRRARGPVVDLFDHAWFDLFSDLPCPTGETTVEIVAAAVRAAG
ncbi:MAG: hypothetical protein ACREEB_08810 [Caulobacteraceae bacterium]